MKRFSIWSKMGVIAALVGLLVLLTGATSAQDAPANSITVDGFGQAFGTPDVAYLQLGVQVTDTDVTAAFNEANELMTAVIGALTEQGIALEDIQTTGLFMYPETAYDPQTGAPTDSITYRVGNSVDVTIRDVSKIGEIVSAGVNAGANNINSLNFGIADTASLESEARTAAVADAKDRAAQLAEALGLTLGGPISVVESFASSAPPIFYDRAQEMGGAGNVPIQQGQLNVNVQVTVTFSAS
jgi:uncharacterized protein